MLQKKPGQLRKVLLENLILLGFLGLQRPYCSDIISSAALALEEGTTASSAAPMLEGGAAASSAAASTGAGCACGASTDGGALPTDGHVLCMARTCTFSVKAVANLLSHCPHEWSLRFSCTARTCARMLPASPKQRSQNGH